MRGRVSTAPRSLQGRMLEEQSSLDELMGELAIGVRSVSHYNELESRADAICAGMRAAFRECRSERA